MVRCVLVAGFDEAEGLAAVDRQALLGAKAEGLLLLRAEGLPVPDGFVLTTDAARHVRANGWDRAVDDAVRAAMASLEERLGAELGAPGPTLVSVRSGSLRSMPGALATVVNVGIGEQTWAGADPAFAADVARRAAASWESVVGSPRPTAPHDQVAAAIRAVLTSWQRPEAMAARRRLHTSDDDMDHDGPLDIAVTVQHMVFGNRDQNSCTGAVVSRDPVTGAPEIIGSVVRGGQGPDVMSGTRPTEPLAVLRERWPGVHDELLAATTRAERRAGDMVDVEFTVDAGTLWLLQARPSARSVDAALRVAVDLAEDPTVRCTRAAAVDRVRHLLDLGEGIDPSAEVTEATEAIVAATPSDGASERTPTTATGTPASPGVAVGVLVVDPADAIERAGRGVSVVLARAATSPRDIPAIACAAGLFTTTGGVASHAAVIARELGVPTVVGAATATVGPGGVDTPDGRIPVGSPVTLDASRGVLLHGSVPAPAVADQSARDTLRRWAAPGIATHDS